MLGTSGTFIGTAPPEGVEPEHSLHIAPPDSAFHGIEGAKIWRVRSCQIYDPTLADENLAIATEDAYAMAKRLAREEGLLVGVSAAAAVVGCCKTVAEQVKPGQRAVIVTILCDSE